MAPKRASNPGKTSRYYQSAKGRKSYEKQKKKQKKINSTPAKRKYRKLLSRKRRELGIMGKYQRKIVPEEGQSVSNYVTTMGKRI